MLHNRSYTLVFFLILSTIKMKLGQILVCCITNISSIFFNAGDWKLVLDPFYDFIKMTIWRDLAILNSWHLPFSIVPYSPFRKNKHWNLDIIGIEQLEQVAKLKRTWNLVSVLQIVQRICVNYCPCLYLSNGHYLMNSDSKDIFKYAPCLMY